VQVGCDQSTLKKRYIVSHKLPKFVVASALVFASAASADIDQTGKSVWTEMVTKEGCIIYAERYPKLMTAAKFKSGESFSWQGSGCQQGKVLNGAGTLTESSTGSIFVRKGRMVDGVFDGPATLTYGTYVADIVYTRGCRFQGGRFDTACTPRKRIAVGSQPAKAKSKR